MKVDGSFRRIDCDFQYVRDICLNVLHVAPMTSYSVTVVIPMTLEKVIVKNLRVGFSGPSDNCVEPQNSRE